MWSELTSPLDSDRAIAALDRAQMFAERTPTLHFSAWRYLRVAPREFVADCLALGKQIRSQEKCKFPAIDSPQATLALFQ